ncbi:hypothetical protein BK127_41465 [Paenibacillus sp. FSL H7-0331]|nr:hypothetical protein BK127_41465 [Paenibacillus sp. FSL H7-0331]
MDELLKVVEKNINSIRSTIERNKKYRKYPFTTTIITRLYCYKIVLDNWESFSKIILSFKNSHCVPVSKMSNRFEKIITVERNSVSGFITRKTEEEMLAYIRVLEWKIDDLQGIWLTCPT